MNLYLNEVKQYYNSVMNLEKCNFELFFLLNKVFSLFSNFSQVILLFVYFSRDVRISSLHIFHKLTDNI